MKRFLFLSLGILLGLNFTVQTMMAQANEASFDLFPNAKFVGCLGVQGGPTPSAHAKVVRGNLNDTLTLTAKNIKPGLAFDLFTIERSALLADGTPDPAFHGFGLAWYQSDVQADEHGNATVTIKTILLDQIFGFDPDVALPPTITFQVGFWFNNPEDAVPCGFDPTMPTPFNGEHKAGPLAMITRPNAKTGLGPLCTNPNPETTPTSCNP